MRALLLLLPLTACAADSGIAGCWEDMGGRHTYRADWAPMANGMCPTHAQMIAAQAVAPDDCRGMCRLRSMLVAP